MSTPARDTDPETSHDAAKSVKNETATQAAILRILREFGPLTDQDILANYRDLVRWGHAPRASESGIRTRRCEMSRPPRARVVDTGARQLLESGRASIVWGLAEEVRNDG